MLIALVGFMFLSKTMDFLKLQKTLMLMMIYNKQDSCANIFRVLFVVGFQTYLSVGMFDGYSNKMFYKDI